MSTVAKKFIMALSGFGLVGFVIVHLLGNLSLYRSDPAVFNGYANTLQGFGNLLIAAELGLLAVALFHVYNGICVTIKNRGSRPERYRVWKSKGGETPSNLSSRNMAITGIVLLVFIIIHICQFKYGTVYEAQVHGETVRDLHRLVVESFKNPLIAGFYVLCMGMLGLHLRHGIWSGFQSLGLTRSHSTRALQMASLGIGAILAIGFLFIPIWIYFFA